MINFKTTKPLNNFKKIWNTKNSVWQLVNSPLFCRNSRFHRFQIQKIKNWI